jgi:hypothetical protein
MGGGGVGFAVVCEAEEEKSDFCDIFCDAMSKMRGKWATIKNDGANEQLSGNAGLHVKCAFSLAPVRFRCTGGDGSTTYEYPDR